MRHEEIVPRKTDASHLGASLSRKDLVYGHHFGL